MSQSPLARSTRRSLPAFAHPPSRLSKSTSSHTLREDADESSGPNSPSPSPSPAAGTPAMSSTPTGTPKYKHASSSTTPRHGTPKTTTTPKIVYSPYATASPHAGPSRSASIPFDMAASAKDVRRRSMSRKESTPDVGTRLEDAGSPAPTPASVPVSRKNGRKAIVRKKALSARLLELPQSLLDRFQYDLPQSILDVLPHPHLANPIALAIHVIHYLLLAPLFPGHNDVGSVLRSAGRAKGRWERFEDEQSVRGRSVASGWTAVIITLLILGLALGNAVYLFSRFKTYDMQLRTASDPVHSPHASPAPAPRSAKADVFEQSAFPAPSGEIDAKRLGIMLGRGLWMTVKFIFSATMAAIGKPTEHGSSTYSSGGEDKMQTLKVWEPPAFSLAFFCALPPTAPLLTHILTSLHPLLTPLIHLSTTFLLSHLATSYAQLVKDRMFLSAEVMREYDQRFVYKKVFGSRVDRGVMTNEAELVW